MQNNTKEVNKNNVCKTTQEYESKEKIKEQFQIKVFIIQLFTVGVPTLWFSWLYPEYKNTQVLSDTLFNTNIKIHTLINILVSAIIIVIIYKSSFKDTSIKDKCNQLLIRNGYYLSQLAFYRNERKNIKKTCQQKVDTLVNIVKQFKNSNGEYDVPPIITNPYRQLHSLMEQLVNNLCQLIKLDSAKCIFSVAYRFDIIDKWEWMPDFKPIDGEDLELLSTQRTSTFYKTTSMKGSHFICYSSKIDAFEAQEYYAKSRKHITDGIIIGKHYYVAINNKPFAEIAIFINNAEMPDTELANVIYNLKMFENGLDDLVFKPYLERIQIELILKYIEMIRVNSNI